MAPFLRFSSDHLCATHTIKNVHIKKPQWTYDLLLLFKGLGHWCPFGWKPANCCLWHTCLLLLSNSTKSRQVIEAVAC